MANIINIGGGAGGSSGGGHTILDNSGTSLTQRAELQFKGAYSEDNSTDQVTEVNVVRSMTKAEFDLLSNDEKAGIINVTDVTGGGENEFQPVIYSEEEREIGVWSDGKPLYQKTVTNVSLTHNAWTTVFDGSSINAQIKDYEGKISLDGSIPYCSIDYYRAQGEFSSGCVANNGAVLNVLANVLNPETLLYCTIWYTKTTDQAGSGTWTPQGVPAVHYSTDEQVVGTWIDGSTLYEKTIVATNVRVSTSDWQNLEQISDIDTLVSTEGTITILFNGQQTGVGQYFSISVNSSGYVRFFCSAWNNENANVYVTIRYTKTST